jgi:hypothetical protein
MGGGAGEGEATWLYVISCAPERVKIGVAADARKRLRELQVGSPQELTLAHTERYGERRDAVAVCEELYRCFAGRRVRGSWYRLTPAELREGLGRPATREAPERARAAAAAAEAASRAHRSDGSQRSGKRSPKQLAYERRRRQERTQKQKQAARLRAAGRTQDEIAADLGVTTRTLRNWKSAPAYRGELERQRARGGRKPASAPASEPKPRPRREPVTRPGRARKPDLATGRQPEPAPAPATSEPAIEPDGGVPIFPDTTEGRTARLAYYEARKLNNLPYSGYDYTDARRGEAPPRERQARQRRDSRRRQ